MAGSLGIICLTAFLEKEVFERMDIKMVEGQTKSFSQGLSLIICIFHKALTAFAF